MCVKHIEKKTTQYLPAPTLSSGGTTFSPKFLNGIRKNECLEGLKIHFTDICLGGLLWFFSKKTGKENMALRTQFEMLILVQSPSNQLTFSYVTLWFF